MALFFLLFANLISAIGITIVAPILGMAGSIFNVNQGYAMWLMTGFMLTYVAFMPLMGRLSDIYGRKKVFVASNFIFSLGLLLSSLSDNFNLIVAGRMIQGFGAGGILPIVNAAVVEMHPDRKERMLALVNATYGLGMILGVNIGGILYDTLGWRWMFILSFLLTIVAIGGVTFFFKEKVKRDFINNIKKIDYPGSLLFAISIASFMIGMKNLSNHSILSVNVLVYFVITILSGIIFAIRELKIENPMMDIRIFKKFNFSLYNFISLFFGFSMFLLVTFIPSYIQLSFGYSVSRSVYSINPFAVSMIISAILGGALIARMGEKKAMFLGSATFLTFVLLFYLFSSIEIGFYITSVLIGIGLGISMTPMNHIVIEEGGKENQGRSAGVVSIMRSLGGIIGPTLAGFIISRIDFSSFFVMDNLLKAYKNIFLMVLISTILMTSLSFVGLLATKSRKAIKNTKEELKEGLECTD